MKDSIINGICYILFDIIGNTLFGIAILVILMLLLVLFVRMDKNKQIGKLECFVYTSYSIISLLMIYTIFERFHTEYIRNQLYVNKGNWTSMAFVASDMGTGFFMAILYFPLIILAIITFICIIKNCFASKRYKLLFSLLALLPVLALVGLYYRSNY